jgi:hypothetical protein
MIRGKRGNKYFNAPTLSASMYDGRNNTRFIPEGIGIYLKNPNNSRKNRS